eukprot:42728-Amphidinium_carterae.1
MITQLDVVCSDDLLRDSMLAVFRARVIKTDHVVGCDCRLTLPRRAQTSPAGQTKVKQERQG